METPPTIVISLGGSLIVPDHVDTAFLNSFVNLVKKYTQQGFRFSLIAGGGATAREYISAAKGNGVSDTDELDWIGIATTRLNAELLRTLFGSDAYEKIIFDPDQIPEHAQPVTLGGGWKPGNSSDLAAIHTAISIGAKKVINLSNIEYAYTADPRTNPDAKRLENVTWAEYRSYIPTEWSPGLSTPFDPIASKRAEEAGIEVAIMNGRNLENLQNYLDGKEFIGTTIK